MIYFFNNLMYKFFILIYRVSIKSFNDYKHLLQEKLRIVMLQLHNLVVSKNGVYVGESPVCSVINVCIPRSVVFL